LGRYEALFKAFQIGLGLWTGVVGEKGRMVPYVENKGAKIDKHWVQRTVIVVEEIQMISPTGVVCI